MKEFLDSLKGDFVSDNKDYKLSISDSRIQLYLNENEIANFTPSGQLYYEGKMLVFDQMNYYIHKDSELRMSLGTLLSQVLVKRELNTEIPFHKIDYLSSH